MKYSEIPVYSIVDVTYNQLYPDDILVTGVVGTVSFIGDRGIILVNDAGMEIASIYKESILSVKILSEIVIDVS